MITEYDPGRYKVFRRGIYKTKTKWIGWMEYLDFCFAWNEI